ncbi:hypothetical protein BRARA_A03629 [Brassica rapa]|uniref:Disease resistance R13L4/SHOC-2-like LRR domain-containing protein n=1 Tax=Brassica campestris TaxID=3711 RepID=A0A398ATN8_BRACM|nr:hypothetical protein BRARA_A03629 [Brassica rapa]
MVVRSILLLSFSDLSYPLKRCFLNFPMFLVNYQVKRKKLVRMWMTQWFEVADGYFGRSKVFKMHDVIKEIALSISKAERLCGNRHLCIQKEMRSGTVSRTNLPSILVCTKFELPPILRLLRSLDLEGSGINKLPDFWLTLFNLKYLNLSKTKVKELLRDFHRLINLETLNTKHSKVNELPLRMWKLWKLPKLIKTLGNMTQLRIISLVMIRREHRSDLCESLNKIKRLRFLSLTSIHKDKPLDIDGLIANSSIEKLFLTRKPERIPSWFSNPQNVTYLGQRGSQLQKNAIHYIQTLPKLVWLSLYNAHMGTRLCFDEGFENLKILDKVQMQHLTEVVIEDGVMFGLQKLYVKARRVLESVQKGIENLVNLQELHLKGVVRSRVKHIPAIKHHFRNENGSFYVSLSS